MYSSSPNSTTNQHICRSLRRSNQEERGAAPGGDASPLIAGGFGSPPKVPISLYGKDARQLQEVEVDRLRGLHDDLERRGLHLAPQKTDQTPVRAVAQPLPRPRDQPRRPQAVDGARDAAALPV